MNCWKSLCQWKTGRKTPTTAMSFSRTHPGSPTGSLQACRLGSSLFQFNSGQLLSEVMQWFWIMCAFVLYFYFFIKGRIECNSLDSGAGLSQGKTDCTIDKPIFKSNAKVCSVYRSISSHCSWAERGDNLISLIHFVLGTLYCVLWDRKQQSTWQEVIYHCKCHQVLLCSSSSL